MFIYVPIHSGFWSAALFKYLHNLSHHIYIFIDIYLNTHTCIYMYTYIYIYIYMKKKTYPSILVFDRLPYSNISILSPHICIFIYIYIHIYAYRHTYINISPHKSWCSYTYPSILVFYRSPYSNISIVYLPIYVYSYIYTYI
jgi:hypothetical protein